MKWLLSRGISIVLLSLLIFVFSHLIIRVIPGDPVDVILAETGTNIPREVLVRDLQLDQPMLPALASQIRNALKGDFGHSIHYKAPIAPLIRARALNSLLLAAVALLLGVSIALILALLSNNDSRSSRWIRPAAHTYAAVLAAAPAAWIAPIFSFVLCVKLRIFPVTGSLALCAIVLGVTVSGFWVRAFSRVIEEEKRSVHYRSAEARGLPISTLLLKYALLPVSGSLLSFLGTQAGWLAAGAVITETIFDWPGLGSLLIESILKRDYPLMEMTICLTSILIFLGNTAGDLLQIVVHPKLREETLR